MAEVNKITVPENELAPGGLQYVCPVAGCGKVNQNQTRHRMHCVKVHKILQNESDEAIYHGKAASSGDSQGKRKGSEIVQFYCPREKCKYHLVDGRKHFKTRKSVKEHYDYIHREKKYKCPKCDSSYSFERFLRAHQQKCQVFICTTCQGRFLSPEALQFHCQKQDHPVPEAVAQLPPKSAPVLKSVASDVTAGQTSKEDVTVLEQNKASPVLSLKTPKCLSKLMPKPTAIMMPFQVAPSGAIQAQNIFYISDPTSQLQNEQSGKYKAIAPATSTASVVTALNIGAASAKSLEQQHSAETQTEYIATRAKATKPKERVSIATQSLVPQRGPISIAQTQTSGDLILQQAMQTADIPIRSQTPGARVPSKSRKKHHHGMQRNCETQTSDASPKAPRKRRRVRGPRSERKTVGTSTFGGVEGLLSQNVAVGTQSLGTSTSDDVQDIVSRSVAVGTSAFSNTEDNVSRNAAVDTQSLGTSTCESAFSKNVAVGTQSWLQASLDSNKESDPFLHADLMELDDFLSRSHNSTQTSWMESELLAGLEASTTSTQTLESFLNGNPEALCNCTVGFDASSQTTKSDESQTGGCQTTSIGKDSSGLPLVDTYGSDLQGAFSSGRVMEADCVQGKGHSYLRDLNTAVQVKDVALNHGDRGLSEEKVLLSSASFLSRSCATQSMATSPVPSSAEMQSVGTGNPCDFFSNQAPPSVQTQTYLDDLDFPDFLTIGCQTGDSQPVYSSNETQTADNMFEDLFPDIGTQTTDLLDLNNIHTQTSDDIFADLCLTDIETQTNFGFGNGANMDIETQTGVGYGIHMDTQTPTGVRLGCGVDIDTQTQTSLGFEIVGDSTVQTRTVGDSGSSDIMDTQTQTSVSVSFGSNDNADTHTQTNLGYVYESNLDSMTVETQTSFHCMLHSASCDNGIEQSDMETQTSHF